MVSILNPKLYARITGVALAATAALGLVLEATNGGKFIPGLLMFDLTHDILHVVLAALALTAGFVAGGAYARTYARIFGVVYTGLAIAGFISMDVIGFLGVHLELGENLVHVLIGVYGLAAGFLGSDAPSTTVTSTPRRA